MYSLLLAIIYMAFISLGLPDALLGSAWPEMHQQFNAPISLIGVVTMIISGGTIISSLFSGKLTRKFGTGLVTAVSVLMTAVAMFGFSISKSIVSLCIWAIPYGLGAGAVDASLNNYVALHYASRHMSWLHCFWGVGASAGPYIMGYCLTKDYGWTGGFGMIALVQFVLTAIFFISLPLWRKSGLESESADSSLDVGLIQSLNIRGVKFVLLTFFGYCALESTTGFWASSYLAEFRGVDTDTAAKFASLFFVGITVGRLLSGFISDRVGDKLLIRYGIFIVTIGVILVGIPIENSTVALAGLIIIGLGCAPIYPSVIHATPANFGKENSQTIIGVQMASAYVGTTFMPPLFGLIADYIHIGLYPVYLLALAALMLIMSETMNKTLANKSAEPSI